MLAGGFEISARKTYGHVSDGMICSLRELALGDDHTGILVLDADTPVGTAVHDVPALRDDVLDIAVSPDRGYCLSIRGVAREAATAYGVAFSDPVGATSPRTADAERRASGDAHEVAIADPTACDRFVLRTVTGVDPTRPTPLRMRMRLAMAGMRPVSLAVDVTNYVMLEVGQPLHAFDAKKLTGPVVVRRARQGERLETLDHVVRGLDTDDILITDSSGPLSLAGTMGGLSSEVDASSTELLIEAAHFPAVAVARMSRRHRLSTEASRRFERGVDPLLPPAAAARAASLLADLGGGAPGGVSEVDLGRSAVSITMPADHPDRVAGVSYGRDTVVRRLVEVGCTVRDTADATTPTGSDADPVLVVEPPAWRPDLTDPNDLVEEVVRLEGYDAVPSALPPAPAGAGLSSGQRDRRLVGRALAAAGFVEVLSYPFVAPSIWDLLGVPPDDPRRCALRLVNPLSDEEPELRTSLLPGLLATLRRNVGRGQTDLALFEAGLVYLPDPDAPSVAPRPPVDRRPTDDEIAALDAALPAQPTHVAAVLAGLRRPAGWWGDGRAATWADAVQAARTVADALHVRLDVRSASAAPWHPGRCAALLLGPDIVGHAGELHPRAVGALDLPERTCAMELDLSAVLRAVDGPVTGPSVSTFPVATRDVALVVDAGVAAADVEEALRAGAGDLLESVRLFDVYSGERLGEGRRSLAYALRFRAADRTLTAGEVAQAHEAAIAEAGRRIGAVPRT